jgi:hypothetical protein
MADALRVFTESKSGFCSSASNRPISLGWCSPCPRVSRGPARSPGHVEIYCELCALIRFETPRPGCCLSLGKGPQKCFETLRGNAEPAHTSVDLRRGRQQARAQRPDSGRRVTRHRPGMCPVAVLALLYVESADSAGCPLVALKTLPESVYPLSNKKADSSPFRALHFRSHFSGGFRGFRGATRMGIGFALKPWPFS